MPEPRPLQLLPRAEARERRLAALLERHGLAGDDPRLREVLEDAWLLGSLELSGLGATWEEVRRSRTGGAAPEAVEALRRARQAVDPAAGLTVAAIRAWHGALAGPVGFRRTPRTRDGREPAPPPLIESRLALLEGWLDTPSARDLRAEQAASVALARIVEVLPFDDGNGRVSRLAATHVMVRGGMRPPVLVAADGPRLVAALQAAFRFETAALSDLLAEASSRALDVMVQSLERGEV